MKRILLALVAAAAFTATSGVTPVASSTAEARPFVRVGVYSRPYYRAAYRPYYNGGYSRSYYGGYNRGYRGYYGGYNRGYGGYNTGYSGGYGYGQPYGGYYYSW